MMSLVGYDLSSGSDDDEDGIVTETPLNKVTTGSEQEGVQTSNINLKLSKMAPKPKENHNTSLFGFAGDSTKGAIRITAPEIPVLDSDDSDGEPESVPKRKKIQPSKSRSGLFAKLPAPKNAAPTGKHSTTSFVPYVFSKPKKNNQTGNTPPIKTNAQQMDGTDVSENDKDSAGSNSTVPSIAEIKRRSAQAAAKFLSGKMAKSSAVDNDSDEDADTGFFSYVEKVPEDNIPDIELPKLDLGNKLAPELPESLVQDQGHYHQTDTNTPYEPFPIEPIAQNNISSGNAEDLLRIQGKRNRNEEINFIDIHADDALVGNKEMLLKQISEEKNMQRTSHSSKKTNAPGGALKRKHQLSYLVHQAKSRELELKNTWAQNRMTKQQTQSKYGF